MIDATTQSAPNPRQAQPAPGPVDLFPLSFVDRFTQFVRRQPIPYGLTYFLLFLLEGLIFHVFSWIDGWLPVYKIDPIAFMYPLWLWGPLAFITYLDSLSLRALEEFAPLLDLDDGMKRKLAHEFTTMPARNVILSSVFWSGVYLVLWFLAFYPATVAYGPGTLSRWGIFILGFASFCVGSVIYYHTMRQLRLVSRTVEMVAQFDLFRLDPVYAFSVVTSRTGICWILLITMTLLVSPLEIGGAAEISLLVVQVVLSLAAFLLPLRAVNRRLAAEKQRRVAVLDQRVKATLERLHQRIDEDSLNEISKLNDVLNALSKESEILAKIPTWPWRPGIFASFVSVILLPILLFLIQLALGKWLGS